MIIAIVLSILILLNRITRPTISTLGRAPDGHGIGDIDQNPGYQPVPGLLILRQNAPMFFANSRKLRQEVLAAATRQTPPCRVALIDLGMNADLDLQSADLLTETRNDLAQSGISLWLGGVHAPVRQMLQRVEFGGVTDGARIFASVADAVATFVGKDERR
jgi:MFS superfamily sulfate permease-like transporter